MVNHAASPSQMRQRLVMVPDASSHGIMVLLVGVVVVPSVDLILERVDGFCELVSLCLMF